MGRKESNLQHTESESVVLPIELLPRGARALRAVTPLAMITRPAGVADSIAWKKYGDGEIRTLGSFWEHTLSKRAPSATRSRLLLLFDGGPYRNRTGPSGLQSPRAPDNTYSPSALPTELCPLKDSLTSIDKAKDVVNYPDDLVRQSDQPHVLYIRLPPLVLHDYFNFSSLVSRAS